MEDVHPDTDQIIQNITQDQWLEYFHQLTLYAESRCSKWKWQTGRQNLPKGYSPQTIANEAVRRLLDGDRTWNHDAYPGNSPIPFLKGVIDSIVNGLGKSRAHRTAASLEEETTIVDSDGGRYTREIEAAQSVEGFRPPPASSPEEKILAEQIQAMVKEAVKDRPDVVTVFEYLWEGLKPAEIAEKMGIGDEVYTKIRFLRRRTEKIATEVLGLQRPITSNSKERRTERRRYYGNRNQ
ncbi:MAG: hypothetical protein L0220_16630 [Acidobacteria bacterium]|nr:hypothetical protein [Acidobacteriota bacterium]